MTGNASAVRRLAKGLRAQIFRTPQTTKVKTRKTSVFKNKFCIQHMQDLIKEGFSGDGIGLFCRES